MFNLLNPLKTPEQKLDSLAQKESRKALASLRTYNSNHPITQTLYCDVDDVVISALPSAINCVNSKYLIPQGLAPKTVSDVKDWEFKSIYRQLTKDQLLDIFESPEFWDMIHIRNDFKHILDSNIFDHSNKKIITPTLDNPEGKCYTSYYDLVFITKGTEYNLLKKCDFISTFLNSYAPHLQYHFLGLNHSLSKGDVDMSGDIMLDDNIENLLESNAKIKILLKNGLETRYNNSFGEYNDKIGADDGLYIADNLEQVKEILEFNLRERL